MRLAILQCPAAGGDRSAAEARLTEALTAAGKAGCDLLHAPELMLPGYNCPETHDREARSFDEMCSDLARMASASGCGVVTGWVERDGDTLYNVATAVSAEGAVLAHHRKCMLFGDMERAGFARGTGAPCRFDYRGRRFGLLICYEIEFPELARDLARSGAEVMLVPTANPAGFEHVQRILLPARANENRAFVAYANFCGTENGMTYSGRSLLAGPDGETIMAAGQAPALLIGELPQIGDYPQDVLSIQAQDLDEMQRG
ncbi:carbon-nitrogen hydrolase family protein [Sagittula sp. NFXS13]|uniref:carbon-nitrogen hydrolase family protein n=1 Tax=Sagittula sp. NFXS13 TaxID=2819095 RepID=UPI0032DE9B50